jgi:hypothetical protein
MRTRIEDVQVGQQAIWTQDTGYGLRHDWEVTVVKVTPKRVSVKRNCFPTWKPISVRPENIRIVK